jgi:glycosyltransferase involved in cell wall biosynthesis
MHILMVSPQPFFRPRGTPLSVLHRIRGLCMLGHTVELVTYPFGDTPEIPGLLIHRSPRPPFVSDVPVGPSVAKLILDVPLFRMAIRFARSGRFDLIHTHEEGGWLGARIRRSTGLPHLYDMHSSLPQQLANFGKFDWGPMVAAFRRLEDRTLRGSDAVIAICQELYDHARAMGYRGPLAMIENTLEFPADPATPEDIGALRTRLHLGDGPVVMYTGTLEPYQRLELLLGAAVEVRRRIPGVAFVVVGGTTAQIEALRRVAAPLGVGEAFRWVGAVPPDEIPRYLQLADALVTTRARGTNVPLKIYQYLRADRPIVATAIRSHTQVLEPGTAELVEPEPSAIAAGLIRVLTDAAHARRLAHAASRLAQERYAETAYLDKLRGLLAQIEPASRARRGAGATARAGS